MIEALALPNDPKELAKGIREKAVGLDLDEPQILKKLGLDVLGLLAEQGHIRKSLEMSKVLGLKFEDLLPSTKGCIIKDLKSRGIDTTTLEKQLRR